MEPFTALERTTLLEHAWWRLEHDRYVRPDTTEGSYYRVVTPGSVIVIPVFDDVNIVMVEQFRYLEQRQCLEFPGGGVHAPSILESAATELREEAGYVADTLRVIGSFNPCNGLIVETCTVVVATGLRFEGSAPEASELCRPVIVSTSDIDTAIKDGRCWSGMSMAAWMLFRLQSLG
jgi:ADP-ribose pyrophosphatase